MVKMTSEQIAYSAQATERARAFLKPGDRIQVERCSSVKRNYIFAGWEGRWIVSRCGYNDISARHILRVNGEPIRFGDPLTPEMFFGAEVAQAWREATDALHKLAQVSFAPPGENVLKHMGQLDRWWMIAKRDDMEANRPWLVGKGEP